MGDYLSGLFRDLGGFLRDAIWNLAIAIYGAIVSVWEILARLQPCLRGPEDFFVPVLVGAIVLGSFTAYRAARQGWFWDTTALQVEDRNQQSFPKATASERHGMLLVIEAKKIIPSPMRLRIELSGRATAVEAEIQRTRPEIQRAVELDESTEFEYKIRRRRIVLQFSNPPLSILERQFIISIRSKEPLSYRSVAAWRNRD